MRAATPVFADPGELTAHPREQGDDVRDRSPFNVTVSAVIPTLNEARNLPHVLPKLGPEVTELIIVDGRSTDDTVDVALFLRPDARIVYETTPGKGAALRAGFEAATGDIIVALDADGSTDPTEIPAFVSALLNGADYAKGSRFLRTGGTDDMPLYRRLGNATFVQLVGILFGTSFTDMCYGYNAFWARCLGPLRLDADGFEIETLMNVRAVQAGLRIAEVPSVEAERIHGESNLKTIPDGWRVLKTILRERFVPRPGVGVSVVTQPPVPQMGNSNYVTVPVESSADNVVA